MSPEDELVMPIVKRRRTIRAALRDVAIAPFVFILFGFWHNAIWLTFLVVLLIILMVSRPGPLADFLPSIEAFYNLLGVFALVALAAVPLALRDYVANGGYETVWEPSEQVNAKVQEFGELLIAGEYQAFHDHFSPLLKTRCSVVQLSGQMLDTNRLLGPPVSICHVTEVEIQEHAFSELGSDQSTDAVAQLQFSHATCRKSNLTLYLNTQQSFQITEFICLVHES